MHKLDKIVEVAKMEEELSIEISESIALIKKYAMFISNIEKREDVFENEIYRYSVAIQKERFKIRDRAKELSSLAIYGITI